jgi:O-Antigen ligase
MEHRLKGSSIFTQRLRWVILTVALFVLVCSVGFIILERLFLPSAWYPYQSDSLLEAISGKPVTRKAGEALKVYSRFWKLPRASKAELNFNARVFSKDQRDIWGRSLLSMTTSWVSDPAGSFTRVKSGLGGDSYLYRSVNTSLPIAGQQFRIEIQMRSRQNIPASGCRGVWLQENGGKYASQCFPTALTPNWKTFRFEWVAPRDATTSSIRVVLNDFDGLEYDVRDLLLSEKRDGKWVTFDQTEPTGASIWLSYKGLNESQLNVPLVVDRGWQAYRLEAEPSASALLTASLWLEGGLGVEVKNVHWNVVTPNSVMPTPLLVNPFRSAAWYQNPNIAGHSLAALIFLILLLSPTFWVGMVAACLATVGIFFTESRAAWLAIVIGIPWLFWFYVPKSKKSFFLVCTGFVMIFVVMIGGQDIFGRLISIDQSEASRQSIWRVAFKTMFDYPWGLPNEKSFSSQYALIYPSISESIQHAHNFWLQMGVRFGILGFFVSLAGAIFLLRFFRLKGKWLGVAFIVPIFLMNIFDYSLDNINVWLCIVFAVIIISISSTRRNQFKPKPMRFNENEVLQ